MLPERGPIAIRIPGISGVTVTAGATGALVVYRWPGTFKLGGIQFCLRSGSDIELASVNLRMLDDDSNELAVDGFGTTTDVPGLALRGIPGVQRVFGGRMQGFQRIVRGGDMWRFQIVNDNAVDVIPELFFQLERAVTVYGKVA